MSLKSQVILPVLVKPACSETRSRIPPRIVNQKRGRLIANAAASSFAYPLSSIELPLLPFNMDEVFVPSETKTLHLFEARYLAMLEECLSRKNRLFVHFVLEPFTIGGAPAKGSFKANYASLVFIENVERLEVGALVALRGIGRVKIVKFVEEEPYLKGLVIPVQDKTGNNVSLISSKVGEVKEALRNLNSLEIKLKTSEMELLQTNAANSLCWAEEEPCVDCPDGFVPPLAERISFAPFQSVSGASESDQEKLNGEKIRAMKLSDTEQRLNRSLILIKKNIYLLAAKLAIQGLE